MAKCVSAERQCWTGIVHFFDIFGIARNITLWTASSFGNIRWLRLTFRSVMFTDSIAFVVYITLRISGGKANNGIIWAQWALHDLLINGYCLSHFFAAASRKLDLNLYSSNQPESIFGIAARKAIIMNKSTRWLGRLKRFKEIFIREFAWFEHICLNRHENHYNQEDRIKKYHPWRKPGAF